jgi:hypothetical protein
MLTIQNQVFIPIKLVKKSGIFTLAGCGEMVENKYIAFPLKDIWLKDVKG